MATGGKAAPGPKPAVEAPAKVPGLREQAPLRGRSAQREAAAAGDSPPLDPLARLQRAVLLGHRADRMAVSRKPQPRVSPVDRAFLAIAAAPTAEAGGQFFGRDDQYEYPTLGFTTRIMGHSGPEIDYKTKQGADGWTAEPEVEEDSDEGENESWALAEGTHAVPDAQVEDAGDRPLSVRVSADMAVQIAAAEEEHNADYRYAKAQILDKADAWLAENLDYEFGPDPTEEAVIKTVDDEINPGLKAHLGLAAYDDFEWSDVGMAYRKAADMTVKRDDNEWHDFDHNRVEEGAEADRRIVHVITAGGTQIGNHPPADVVKVDEVVP